MKKWAAVVVMFVFAQIPAMAAEKGTPGYEAMKAYKVKQRAEREQRKAEEKTGQAPKEKGFWQREAERSGFAGTGAMFTHALSSAVPLDKPNSKKSS